MPSISEWVAKAHRNAVEHGWWPPGWASPARAAPVNDILAKIALMHSELSEALEEVRHGRWHMRFDFDERDRPVTRLDKPEGLVVELADCVIRIFDLCGALGLDLEGAIEAKHAYNVNRPHRHGGKLA